MMPDQRHPGRKAERCLGLKQVFLEASANAPSSLPYCRFIPRLLFSREAPPPSIHLPSTLQQHLLPVVQLEYCTIRIHPVPGPSADIQDPGQLTGHTWPIYNLPLPCPSEG